MSNRKITMVFQSASMGASIASDPISVDNFKGFAIQAVWSAGSTPVGVLTLESSHDGTNWDTVLDSEKDVSGNSGSESWNVPDADYPLVRVYYTRTSGSATLAASFNGKG
jgi:hypothetical protein